MKAEERHRLHENDLQRLAEHARERTRPFFDQYGVALLLGLAAVLVVIAGVVWWSKRQSVEGSQGWVELSKALNDTTGATAESFGAIADSYPESDAAVWARLREGELRLGTGLEGFFSDRAGAVRDLEDAQAAFEKLLDAPNIPPTVAVRAQFGLARAVEAASDGTLEPAIERYQQVVDQYGDTVYAEYAKARVEELKAPGAADFYTWFSKAKSPLQDPLQRPQDGGNPFLQDSTSGEIEGPAFPELPPGLELPDREEPASDAALPDTSAVDPTDEAPMAESPSEEPPAGDAETSSP